MLGDRGLVAAQLRQQPVAGRAGVGHRLLGGEGLGGDDEQRALGVEAACSVSARWVPSTLETKCARRPVAGVGRERLGQTISGPRSEPPMPMLTMSVIRLPVWPCHAPLRTRSVNAAHARQHAVDVGHDVRAVDQDRPVAAVAQRDVQDGAVLGVVDLLRPRTSWRASSRRRRARARSNSSRMVSGVDAVLAVVEQQVLEAQRQLARSARGRPRTGRAGWCRAMSCAWACSACQAGEEVSADMGGSPRSEGDIVQAASHRPAACLGNGRQRRADGVRQFL